MLEVSRQEITGSARTARTETATEDVTFISVH